jgi:hypothetical protein
MERVLCRNEWGLREFSFLVVMEILWGLREFSFLVVMEILLLVGTFEKD